MFKQFYSVATGASDTKDESISPAPTDSSSTQSPSPAMMNIQTSGEEEKKEETPDSPPTAAQATEQTPAQGYFSSSLLSDRRWNAESMSAAASFASSSMRGFMRKAQSAASVAAREGAAKASTWKAKAVDVADMDSLQRRLSQALDRSTGEVDIELLNFAYITDSLVAMGFPSMNQGTNRSLLRDNPIDLVSTYMNSKHSGHYMIYNLSEETYDYAYFDNQVLEFNFPGHPAPPLGLMFKICSSMENWLLADDKNLAAVHCLTGKGRTGTVIACYLAWTGQCPNALAGLEFVAEQRQSTVEKLTIPSQRRYIEYFDNVMDGVKPRSSPLLLRRVIINSIPVFGKRKVLSRPHALDEEEKEEVEEEGCCPYLQVFKGGNLVFTTTWKDVESGTGVQWASRADGSVSFSINALLQGDVLVRCRHLTEAGQRVSMFRAAFHTGYIPQGILRLTKQQLDGACGDKRFDSDFFIDLIFGEVQSDGDEDTCTPHGEGLELAQEDRKAYEDMLHRDEEFWADIESRKERVKEKRVEENKKREAAKVESPKQTNKSPVSFSIDGDAKEVKTSRKDSWDEEKDKALMSELESITSPAKKTEVAPDTSTPDDGLDMDKLEKELGLEGDLDALEGLAGKEGESDDLMNFEAEDFDELEEYLTGLSKSSGQ